MAFRTDITPLQLYMSFAKVGAMTIGGGYAMIPSMEQVLCKERALAPMEEIMEQYTVAQLIPGVIAANTAAIIGYRTARVPGAIASVLGVVSPSILVIAVVASVFSKIQHVVWVQKAFYGIRIAVLALLFNALIRLFKKSIADGIGVAIAVIGFIWVVFFGQSPVWMVLFGGLAGVLIYGRRRS